MTELTVVAKVKAKKGKETVLREALISLLAPTHAEAGCVNYDLHQSMDDPTLFIFYENWKDEKSLNSHLQSPHIQRAMASAGSLIDGPLEIYRLTQLHQPKTAGRPIGFP